MQHLVKTEDIGIGLVPGYRGMPVHIPFHILDLRPVEDPGHGLDDIIPHFGLCQIQQKLIASIEGIGAGRGEHPFGMPAEALGVGIHRLGFKPETELHSKVVNRFTKFF
jgi:hypothetical protein